MLWGWGVGSWQGWGRGGQREEVKIIYVTHSQLPKSLSGQQRNSSFASPNGILQTFHNSLQTFFVRVQSLHMKRDGTLENMTMPPRAIMSPFQAYPIGKNRNWIVYYIQWSPSIKFDKNKNPSEWEINRSFLPVIQKFGRKILPLEHQQLQDMVPIQATTRFNVNFGK